eukprot:637292-Amphidinium_carterae.1
MDMIRKDTGRPDFPVAHSLTLGSSIMRHTALSSSRMIISVINALFSQTLDLAVIRCRRITRMVSSQARWLAFIEPNGQDAHQLQ